MIQKTYKWGVSMKIVQKIATALFALTLMVVFTLAFSLEVEASTTCPDASVSCWTMAPEYQPANRRLRGRVGASRSVGGGVSARVTTFRVGSDTSSGAWTSASSSVTAVSGWIPDLNQGAVTTTGQAVPGW